MSTQREWAGRITWGVTAAVAVAGIVMSADQLVHLAQLAGWAGNVRWLLPVLLDGSGVAGGLAYKFAPTRGARRWGLWVLIESAALSVFGNVSAHMITEQVAPVWVAAVVAVAVPLQIVLTVHMGILLSDQPADEVPNATQGATAPVAPATAQPATATAEPATTATPVTGTATAPATTATTAPARPAEPVAGETDAAAPQPDTQPIPRLRAVRPEAVDHVDVDMIAVPAQTPAEAAAAAAEGADTDEAPNDGPGAIQGAMWLVYARHRAAGTDDDLTAAQLAREAGRGSRQLASRYLRDWRQDPQGVTA